MAFNLEGLTYYADGHWYDQFTWLVFGFAVWVGLGRVIAPVHYKQTLWSRLLREKIPSQSDISERLGFDKKFTRRCKLCERDFFLRQVLIVLIYFFLCFLLVLPVYFLIFFISLSISSHLLDNANIILKLSTALLISIIHFFSLLILLGLSMKLGSSLIDKHFASSLAIRMIFHLLVELNHPNALQIPTLKKSIVYRISAIRNYNNMLGYQMSRLNVYHANWIKRHFGQIDCFIQERQRWAIVPSTKTELQLERDFRYLLVLYLHNRLGDFHWSSEAMTNFLSGETSVTSSVSGEKVKNRPIRDSLKFIIAVFPLIIFISLLWEHSISDATQKSILSTIDISPDFIALITITWLLVIIDRGLNIGILDSVVNIAKGIRDLNK